MAKTKKLDILCHILVNKTCASYHYFVKRLKVVQKRKKPSTKAVKEVDKRKEKAVKEKIGCSCGESLLCSLSYPKGWVPV